MTECVIAACVVCVSSSDMRHVVAGLYFSDSVANLNRDIDYKQQQLGQQQVHTSRLASTCTCTRTWLLCRGQQKKMDSLCNVQLVKDECCLYSNMMIITAM